MSEFEIELPPVYEAHVPGDYEPGYYESKATGETVYQNEAGYIYEFADQSNANAGGTWTSPEEFAERYERAERIAANHNRAAELRGGSRAMEYATEAAWDRIRP